MQWGHNNELVAREAYIAKQRDKHDRTIFVNKSGLLRMKVYYTCDLYIILTLQQDNWLAASLDGLVLDCSDYDNPCGLLEIKCPARAEKVSLVDLCT